MEKSINPKTDWENNSTLLLNCMCFFKSYKVKIFPSSSDP